MTLSEIMFKKAGNVVWRNIQVRSCNHCCSGKAISVTFLSVCLKP